MHVCAPLGLGWLGCDPNPKSAVRTTEVKQTLPRAGCYRPVAGRAVVEQYNAPRGPPAGGVWTRRAGRRRGEANGVGRHPRRRLTSVARRKHGDASRAAGCARTQELQVVHGGADHRAPLTPPPHHPQRATRWPTTQAAHCRQVEHPNIVRCSCFRRDHSSASPRSWARTAPANPT